MKVEVTSSATLEQVLTDSIPFVANECRDPFQSAVPLHVSRPPLPLFVVGQPVTAISFVDCFGKHVPERTGLVVSDVRLIECDHVAPYYRVKADDLNGLGYVEGAERFFKPAEAKGGN